MIIFLSLDIASELVNDLIDVDMIRMSYFALRRCLGMASIISLFPDEVSKRVVVGIVSHFLLDLVVYGIPLFYDDVSCIDDLVQSRIPEFVLV